MDYAWPSLAVIVVTITICITISEESVSSKIYACGIACDSTDQKMLRYNEQDGCVCSEKNKL